MMASFANSALADHLTNFIAHATRARIPFVIGAVDEAAYTMLSAQARASAAPLVARATSDAMRTQTPTAAAKPARAVANVDVLREDRL